MTDTVASQTVYAALRGQGLLVASQTTYVALRTDRVDVASQTVYVALRNTATSSRRRALTSVN